MTDPRQAERERVAKALIYELTHRDTEWKCCLEDDEAVQLIVQHDKATEAATLEEAEKHVLNGSFLHDKAPTAMFAKEVAAMLRRKAQERRS